MDEDRHGHPRRRLRARGARGSEASGAAVRRHGARRVRVVRRWRSLAVVVTEPARHAGVGSRRRGQGPRDRHARAIVLHHGRHQPAASDDAAGGVNAGPVPVRAERRRSIDRAGNDVLRARQGGRHGHGRDPRREGRGHRHVQPDGGRRGETGGAAADRGRRRGRRARRRPGGAAIHQGRPEQGHVEPAASESHHVPGDDPLERGRPGPGRRAGHLSGACHGERQDRGEESHHQEAPAVHRRDSDGSRGTVPARDSGPRQDERGEQHRRQDPRDQSAGG